MLVVVVFSFGEAGLAPVQEDGEEEDEEHEGGDPEA